MKVSKQKGKQKDAKQSYKGLQGDAERRRRKVRRCDPFMLKILSDKTGCLREGCQTSCRAAVTYLLLAVGASLR